MSVPQKADISRALLDFIKTSILEKDIEITTHTSFDQLGIDSLSIIELVLFIERKFRVVIPEDELVPTNLDCVESLATCTFKNLPT